MALTLCGNADILTLFTISMGQAHHMPDTAGATGRTILVVEDDVLSRLDICDHLRSKGYHVIETGTAEEAMAVLSAREPVDVIFCDVLLPGKTGGLTFTVWVREHFPSMPVILTSGIRVVTQNMVLGRPVAFIPKPYDPEQVAGQIMLSLSDARAAS